MAGGWATQRPVDDSDDIDAWMAQRNANAALRQQAEAMGRDLWDQATRDGQDLSAAQPSDLVTIGAGALSQNEQPTGSPDSPDSLGSASNDAGGSPGPQQSRVGETMAPQSDSAPIAATTPSYRFATAMPGDSMSRLLGTSDYGAIGRFVGLNGMDGRTSLLHIGRSYVVPAHVDDASPDEIALGQRLVQSDNAKLSGLQPPTANDDGSIDHRASMFNAGLNPWTGDYAWPGAPPPQAQTVPTYHWWDRSGMAKSLAGNGALYAGQAAGLARGGLHMVEDLGEVARLFNPIDPFISPPGEAAWDHVIGAGGRIVRYAQDAISNPGSAGRDLQDQFYRANVDLNPDATPMADTLPGEVRRNFHIGANQGEFDANLVPLLLGGEGLKGLSALRLADEAARAGLLAKHYPQAADYFGELYDGAGHHYFSQKGGNFANMGGVPLPAPLRQLPLPSILRDSGLFRLRPDEITNDEMFSRHIQSDPQYFGGKIPAEYGGGGWSGAQAGVQKLSPALRMWAGASLPLKVTLAGGVLGGAAASSYLDDWSNP